MKTSIVILISCICLSIIGCGTCDGENPSILLINNGTGKADIQIKTSGGNTENLNNIGTGELSKRQSFAPGETEFTIAIQGVDTDILYILYSSSCYDYNVTIHPDNTVTSSGAAID